MGVELGISQHDRVALFIDGANLYFTTKSLNFDIDYRKLLKLFQRQGRLVRAFYYTALFEDNEYSPIRPLVDWLDYNGYTIVTKPAKEYTDTQGRRKIKGNMDMELAIDMLDMADKLDHAVLFSGDGDFKSLLHSVQRHGLRVTVVSTLKTQPPMIADELRRQADEFIDLTDIADEICRDHGSDMPLQRPANVPRITPRVVPEIVSRDAEEAPLPDDEGYLPESEYEFTEDTDDDEQPRLDPYGEAMVERVPPRR